MPLPPSVTVHHHVELAEPVLVAAFAGWNDAGDAATWAARHLRKRWAGSLVASIDGEEFTDFSTTRPVVTLEGTDRHIVWPRTEVHACGLPASPRDVLVLTATEPQLRWRTYCATVLELAQHLGVKRIITLGALLGDVPHSRPVVVYGSSDDAGLSHLGLARSSYEGPTGIVGVLNDACGQQEVPAASLWATVPGYVPGASSPKAALALVERLGEVLDVMVPLGGLPDAAKEYEQQLDSLVAEDDETAAYVAELEQHYDDEHATDPDELPANADDLVAELERFLREQSD